MLRANEQLQTASVTDSLTGLGNRRFLQQRMAELLGQSPNPVRGTLMVVDLDMLKPINDQYGHLGGDAVLIQTADILRRVFRAADVIVRWGGDEFVVLCLNADLATACALAERLRSAIAKQLFRVGDGVMARTSCSIGFAPLPFVPGHAQLVDWEQVLSIADHALYAAKRERNTWLGWGATEKAAELPSVIAALTADAAGLERDGYLVARRRPWSPEDTVDHLRVSSSPGGN